MYETKETFTLSIKLHAVTTCSVHETDKLGDKQKTTCSVQKYSRGIKRPTILFEQSRVSVVPIVCESLSRYWASPKKGSPKKQNGRSYQSIKKKLIYSIIRGPSSNSNISLQFTSIPQRKRVSAGLRKGIPVGNGHIPFLTLL